MGVGPRPRSYRPPATGEVRNRNSAQAHRRDYGTKRFEKKVQTDVLTLSILGVVGAFVLFFMYIAYCRLGGRRKYKFRAWRRTQLDQGIGMWKKPKRRDGKDFDRLDPIALIQAVEDSADPRVKLSALSQVQAFTRERIRRLKGTFGDNLIRLEKEQKYVDDLERKLQETQRDMAIDETDPTSLRRLVDLRGEQMYGHHWHAGVNGQPSLSQLVAGTGGEYLYGFDDYDQAENQNEAVDEQDFELWQIGPENGTETPRKHGSRVHPAQDIVPKLALEKL